MKNGWLLLIESLICGCIAFFIFVTIGDQLGGNAGNYVGLIAAIVGFISPSIVYFGNRI